jgi:hypothetical protein
VEIIPPAPQDHPLGKTFAFLKEICSQVVNLDTHIFNVLFSTVVLVGIILLLMN